MSSGKTKRVNKPKVKFEPKAGRDYTLAEMLKENLNTIIEVGDILNKSQPPCEGKIEVRYWAEKGRGPKLPTVVVWSSTGKVVRIPPTKLPPEGQVEDFVQRQPRRNKISAEDSGGTIYPSAEAARHDDQPQAFRCFI